MNDKVREYTVTLNLQEYNIIGEGLQNIILKHSLPVVRKIEEQLAAQISAENADKSKEPPPSNQDEEKGSGE